MVAVAWFLSACTESDDRSRWKRNRALLKASASGLMPHPLSWKDANHAEEDRSEGQGAVRAAGAGALAGVSVVDCGS
jgi:hypothetical protein